MLKLRCINNSFINKQIKLSTNVYQCKFFLLISLLEEIHSFLTLKTLSLAGVEKKRFLTLTYVPFFCITGFI